MTTALHFLKHEDRYYSGGTCCDFPLNIGILSPCDDLRDVARATLTGLPGGNCSVSFLGIGGCPSDTPADGRQTAVIQCQKRDNADGTPGALSTPVSIAFTQDTTPPVVEIFAPAENQVFGLEPVTIAMSARDDLSPVIRVVVNFGGKDYKSLGAGMTVTVLPEHLPRSKDPSDPVFIGALAFNVLENPGTAQRSIFVDGTPPSLAITNPSNGATISSLPEIAGTAADAFGLRQVLLSIREDSTGKYWGGAGFAVAAEPVETAIGVSGTADSWSYGGLTAADLTHLETYTIAARAEDEKKNVSSTVTASFTASFTVDLCAPGGPTFVYRGVLGDLAARPDIACVAHNCGREAPVTGNPPAYVFPEMTAAQLNFGIRLVCEDPNRTCPMPDAGPRDDPFGDGAFNAPRVFSPHAVNAGADFAYGLDSGVRAGIAGKVIFAGEFAPGEIAGNTGRGYVVATESRVRDKYVYTIYSHLQPGAAVVAGQNVSAGQVIGTADNTGRAGAYAGQPGFQPHLNVEVWDPVIPMPVPPGAQNLDLYWPWLPRMGRRGEAVRFNSDSYFACRDYGACQPPKVTITPPVDATEVQELGGRSKRYDAGITFPASAAGLKPCKVTGINWNLAPEFLGTLSPRTGNLTVFSPLSLPGSGKVVATASGPGFAPVPKEAGILVVACPLAEHNLLQGLVEAFCRVGRACTKAPITPTACREWQQNLAVRRECLNARIAVTDRCFRGVADKGHADAVADEITGIQKCEELVEQCTAAGF